MAQHPVVCLAVEAVVAHSNKKSRIILYLFILWHAAIKTKHLGFNYYF